MTSPLCMSMIPTLTRRQRIPAGSNNPNSSVRSNELYTAYYSSLGSAQQSVEELRTIYVGRYSQCGLRTRYLSQPFRKTLNTSQLYPLRTRSHSPPLTTALATARHRVRSSITSTHRSKQLPSQPPLSTLMADGVRKTEIYSQRVEFGNVSSPRT